eukprot:CAMPEP_0195108802 /NCGR_PEP_ID=MMETSP0448-20130528/86752_1 /TAXON_ID=66468 /ORGANISM="Heterocapsa triquestra, Strain CCMP 448" /LENGTH=71 /DNA_ID=CAMNT_0040145371 /DNA_START=10 /DNA_END=225 /DNA_ORIENTATION=-
MTCEFLTTLSCSRPLADASVHQEQQMMTIVRNPDGGARKRKALPAAPLKRHVGSDSHAGLARLGRGGSDVV